MNFLQLRYFKTVAELEHMTKAAGQLYISQPALSKSMHMLEQEVGYPLFDREGTGIHLNGNGRILYRYASEILSALDNAMTEISDINNHKNQVSLSMIAGTRFLPEIIMGIKNDFPHIHLSIRQESFGDSRHNCDLYLHSSTTAIQGDSAVTLLSERCLLGLSKDNPLSTESCISPGMLRNQVFLTMPDQLPLYKITYELCTNAGFKPDTGLQFDNRETIFDLISANMGISIIPEKTWAPYITHPDIVLRPLTAECFRYIVLRWPEEHYLTRASRTVVSYLKEYFGKINTMEIP